MHQLQQGHTAVVQQQRPGQKGFPIGPILLACSAWFISVPWAVYGLFWCLRWMVPKPPARLPIPDFFLYPLYIIMWISSAFAAIATVFRPLGVVAILLALVSIFWPRTPLLVRVITTVVLVLSIVGSWMIQSRMPSPTFPF